MAEKQVKVMIQVQGLNHVSLHVPKEKFEPAIVFYRDVLGLRLVRLQDTAAFLSCGNTVVEILDGGEMSERGGALEHIAFDVDDVEGMVRQCEAAGCPVTTRPKVHVFPGKEPYRVYIAFILGPAGEEVEFFKEL